MSSISTCCSTTSPCMAPSPAYQRTYTVTQYLGKGGYGKVWKAKYNTDPTEGGEVREVAIKTVHRKIIKNSPFKLYRALRELWLMSHFRNHPNIMGLEDVFPIPSPAFDTLGLVMKLMESDLKCVLRPPGATVPPSIADSDVKRYLYQILSGLYHLHSAGVAHRDVKPSNLLVNLTDNSLRIADFGLARSLPEQETLTDYVVTRCWRPPELLMEEEHYDQSVDMWSVGCIFGELLAPSHQVLFAGRDRFEQLAMILRVTGSPTKEDIKGIGSREARKYIRDHFSGLCEGNLSEVLGIPPPSRPSPAEEQKEQKHNNESGDDLSGLPEAERSTTLETPLVPSTLDLLRRMLTFNPAKRITAQEAMRHEYFEGVYHLEDEVLGTPFDLDQKPVEMTLSVIKFLIFNDVNQLVEKLHPDTLPSVLLPYFTLPSSRGINPDQGIDKGQVQTQNQNPSECQVQGNVNVSVSVSVSVMYNNVVTPPPLCAGGPNRHHVNVQHLEAQVVGGAVGANSTDSCDFSEGGSTPLSRKSPEPH